MLRVAGLILLSGNTPITQRLALDQAQPMNQEKEAHASEQSILLGAEAVPGSPTFMQAYASLAANVSPWKGQRGERMASGQKAC